MKNKLMWFFLGVFATVATFGIIGCVVFYESTSRYLKIPYWVVHPLNPSSTLPKANEHIHF